MPHNLRMHLWEAQDNVSMAATAIAIACGSSCTHDSGGRLTVLAADERVVEAGGGRSGSQQKAAARRLWLDTHDY